MVRLRRDVALVSEAVVYILLVSIQPSVLRAPLVVQFLCGDVREGRQVPLGVEVAVRVSHQFNVNHKKSIAEREKKARDFCNFFYYLFCD